MKRVFRNWGELETWLDARGLFHMELGLARMENGLVRLDLEKPPFLACQALGTNGKGSTCAFLDALCRRASLKTGLYTSPHFLSPRERCRVDGRMTTERDWLCAANEIAAKIPAWRDLTYFEFATLAALLMFRAAGCAIVILEAGLGGANDATTAVSAQAMCFSPIALDHRQVIGPTLADIAADKAAAIRPGVRVFSAPQFPLAKSILEKAARKKGAAIEFCQPWPMPAQSLLGGEFQARNMGVAAAAGEWLLKLAKISPLSRAEIDAALASAFIPGRRQHVGASLRHPALLLDGAHNPHAIAANVTEAGANPDVIIFSCLADKDWRPGLALLAKTWPRARFFVPRLRNSRAANAAEVAAWLNSLYPGRAEAITSDDSVRQALQRALEASPAGLTLVTGSFFLLAEFYALFPEHLENPRASRR